MDFSCALLCMLKELNPFFLKLERCGFARRSNALTVDPELWLMHRGQADAYPGSVRMYAPLGKWLLSSNKWKCRKDNSNLIVIKCISLWRRRVPPQNSFISPDRMSCLVIYAVIRWAAGAAEKNFIECSEMCQIGKKAHQNQYIPTV